MAWPDPTIHPSITLALLIIYGLCILAYPPRHRSIAFILYLIPATHAFIHHSHITPRYDLNDTLGRMLYIWAVYFSYVLLIEKWEPHFATGEDPGLRERFRLAGKVLYTRKLGAYHPRDRGRMEEKADGVAEASTPQPSPLSFGVQKLLHASLCLGFKYLTDKLSWWYIPPLLHHAHTPLVTRLSMTYDVCITDALYFKALHSLFAVLFVCIFRLDNPSEWPSLFGPLSSAYTVRRYWGVYWHGFIRESFPAHTKLFTRRLCGWKNPSALRRVVENGAVFAVSGAAHALVSLVQTQGSGEVLCVFLWYAAQMIPILVEGVVRGLWIESRFRAGLGKFMSSKTTARVERVVGYVWVFGWMVWSVPLYLTTKHNWEMENLRSKYRGLFDRVSKENE